MDSTLGNASDAKIGFHDIKQEVIRRVHRGIWAPGSLLPTEIELAAEFGCARATVNRAMRELAEQGLVERKRKSGTRVKTSPVRYARFEIELVRRAVEDMGAKYRYALVHKSIEAAPDWVISQLSLGPGEQVAHIKCMHYADNRPFQYEERWIIISTVPAILEADLETQSPNEWLLNEVPFTDAEITLSSVAADAALCEFLATSQGTPLFRLERTTWLDSKVVTYVRMTFRQGHSMTTRY
ncbi:GntR family transcriptional regulator [Ascidiaceihabitans sp.]|uniref:GntR family transcriptional regulator n=1 Tax=Ascidiaceihabitans sp. TaxID=1872644 RepID=UPI003296FB83